MTQKTHIHDHLKTLRMPTLRENLDRLLMAAEEEKISYQTFLYRLLTTEVEAKTEKQRQSRIKQSRLNIDQTIDQLDYTFQTAISRRTIQQILAFEWLEQAFNLLFLGPPGVGKTFLSNAIGMAAVHAGYRVIFITMDELMQTLKTQEVIKRSEKLLKKIRNVDLVIIDELGYLPVSKMEANLFFQLISEFYENRSIIVTSNKGLSKWAEVFGDPVITTAILDRLMHHSEIFNLSGKSYRLENRKKIFSKS